MKGETSPYKWRPTYKWIEYVTFQIVICILISWNSEFLFPEKWNDLLWLGTQTILTPSLPPKLSSTHHELEIPSFVALSFKCFQDSLLHKSRWLFECWGKKGVWWVMEAGNFSFHYNCGEQSSEKREGGRWLPSVWSPGWVAEWVWIKGRGNLIGSENDSLRTSWKELLDKGGCQRGPWQLRLP